MSLVNAEIKMQGNNDAFFTTNAAVVYPANIQIFHNDGRYKFTDGVTALSALSFLGGAGTGLSGLTTNYIPKATASDTIGNSGIIEEGSGTYIQNTDFYVTNSTEAQIQMNMSLGFESAYISSKNNKYLWVYDTEADLTHNNKIKLNSPLINLPQLTASQIVETDASKNLVSVAKGTAYNKDFGTTAGTVLEGDKGVLKTGDSMTGAFNEAKSTDIASAATTDLSTSTGNLIHITGTTTITSFGTLQAGAKRTLVFDGILTLTHNGTSLILPNAANITTKVGDTALFISEGSGNWRCVTYQDSNIHGSWIPTFTGFSVLPTDYTADYILIGDSVTINYNWNVTTGTSNATTFTMTMPFVARYSQRINLITVQNAGGTPTVARLALSAGSNIATIYSNVGGSGFTASGQKGAWINLTYIKA